MKLVVSKNLPLLRRSFEDSSGLAATEFALVAPSLLMLIAIAVFAGQGFDLQRKVTQSARTLTDLVAQQSNVGTSSSTYTYTQILAATSLVMSPYDPSQISMAISEINVTSSAVGTVVWSVGTGPNPPTLTVGATVPLNSTLSPTVNSNLIYGAVAYTYNPLSFWFPQNAVTLADSLYLAPRDSTASVACCN